MKYKAIVLIMAISCVFAFSTLSAQASSISYPFDSITIVSAFHFEVIFDQDPDVNSYFYGKVNEGDTLYIYSGDIVLVGSSHTHNSKIIIITNEDDENIASWIINTSNNDIGIKETVTYSSHITIDPTIGVITDLNNFNYFATIVKTEANECVFKGGDNANTFLYEFAMVPGTYQEQLGLNIVISAFGGI